MSDESDEKKCAQCGEPLPAGTPEGLCPACLLKRAFETQTAGGAAAADFAPPPPEELARYFPQLEILELLGRGGMGVVYKARQPQLDRFVALKILPAAADRDPAFAERFSREARALARLGHPNIVAVYDFGQTGGGLFYFVMEYVDGLNLRQLLATEKITPQEALAIVPQICEALQTAHDQGIVHRDIKPENILLDKKGRVKIADFGIAKIVGGEERDMTLTGAGEVMGTPAYMAPEQIEHPRDVDHRADIYSLGVVFYQMLTGELPLGKFSPPSSRMHGVQIDVRLDEVVLRALEKEPELRYQQASEVRTQVETIAGSPQRSTGGLSGAAVEGMMPQELDRLRLQLMGGGVLMAISGICAGNYLAAYVQKEAGVAMGAWGVFWCGVIAVLAWAGRGNFERLRTAARVTVIDGIGVVAVVMWLAWNASDLGTPWRVCLMVLLGSMIVSSCLKLACVWPDGRGLWAPDGRKKQAAGYVAVYLGFLSGLIPMLFYWMRPSLAPWLSPRGQELMLWATLWVGICAVVVGLGARRSRMGRYGLVWGGISLTIWVLFYIAGWISGSRLGASHPATQRAQVEDQRAAPTEQVSVTYEWPLVPGENLSQEHLVNADGRDELKITNTNDLPLQLTLLKIEKPPIASMNYSLGGEIKYEGVQGAGYLEMWNYFPPVRSGLPEGRYFSRTLAPAGSGPMGQIAGTSSWREFSLPFNRTGSTSPPSRLEFNIFLPGRGVVYIGPLKLRQLDGSPEPAATSH